MSHYWISGLPWDYPHARAISSVCEGISDQVVLSGIEDSELIVAKTCVTQVMSVVVI